MSKSQGNGPDRELRLIRICPPQGTRDEGDAGRFGEPNSYSLPPWELARHVRRLRHEGWQSWEIRARFTYHGRGAA
jgi:hypothetical protein